MSFDWTVIKRAREDRANQATGMKSLVETASKENRGLTEDESARFDEMDAKLREMDAQIERMERAREVDAQSAASHDRRERAEFEASKTARVSDPTPAQQNLAFRAWALGGEAASDEMREAARSMGVDISRNKRTLRFGAADITYRATGPQTITTTKGGYTIDTILVERLEEAMLAYGGVRQSATVVRTQTGGTMNFPTVDDTSNKATILAINTAAAGKDITFGQIALDAKKYTSGIVLVPMELMQDEAVNLVDYIGRALGTRVARGTNEHFTTGQSTSGQPRGISVEAGSGVAVTTGTVITYARLMNLVHSVDPEYRRMAKFMMHDNILRDVRKLVDSQGLPLWQPSLISGEPDRLFGYEYVINQDMTSSTTATNEKVVLFGDLSKYLVRDVQDVEFMRLDERYAEKAQVAFLTFSRHDGRTLIASTGNKPIQAMLAAST